jgi:hypothetical protein
MLLFVTGGLLASLIQPVSARNYQPAVTMPAIIINEVAWAGTRANSQHEWIELYNTTSTPVDMTGWTLKFKELVTGTVLASIDLSANSIAGTSYFLLERFELATSVTANMVYNNTFDLADAGMTLELRDGASTLVDSANFNGGNWPAGVGSPDYCSMERSSDQLDADTSWTNGAILPFVLDEKGFLICGSPAVDNNLAPTPINTNTFTPTQTNIPTFTSTATPNFTPNATRALIINEVAWMGTRSNTTADWLEIYNPGTTNINLSGWTLTTSSGLTVPLEGEVRAGSFFLIESIDDNTVINWKADLIISTADPFKNEGDSLLLKDPSGTTVDTANLNGGVWPAGTDYPDACSMERIPGQLDGDTAWVTSTGSSGAICGTPKTRNSSLPLTATPTKTATGTITPTPTKVPSFANTYLVINEIAWMGTAAYPNSEWIEIFNPNEFPVNLAGWILRAPAGALNIQLDGTIKSGGYYLLEREDDLNIKNIIADKVYFGALMPDTGQDLELVAPDGKVKDSVKTINGNWPAGSGYPEYCSMERGGAVLPGKKGYWLTDQWQIKTGVDSRGNTICGSPKWVNWAVDVTPTITRTPTKTATPYRSSTPYLTPTRTKTPKRSPTPTRNVNATPVPAVYLNEVLPQPRFDWNGDGKVDTGDEFVEIINVGIRTITITGWSIDDQDGDSPKYTIPDMSIAPGAKIAFFSSDTGLLFSTGGDSVRLFMGSGLVSDAFSYEIVKTPNQSWCRLPDGRGQWFFGCAPTVKTNNKIAESSISGNRVESNACLSKKTPILVRLAECDTSGLMSWGTGLWADSPSFPLFFESGADEYILY